MKFVVADSKSQWVMFRVNDMCVFGLVKSLHYIFYRRTNQVKRELFMLIVSLFLRIIKWEELSLCIFDSLTRE